MNRGALCLGQFAGDAANGVGRDGAFFGHAFGRECLGQFLDFVEAGEVLFQVAQLHEVFLEEDVHDGDEEIGVGSGANEEVLIGELGRFGDAGVHGDDTSPPAAGSV